MTTTTHQTPGNFSVKTANKRDFYCLVGEIQLALFRALEK
jgi:hypothetical protein